MCLSENLSVSPSVYLSLPSLCPNSSPNPKPQSNIKPDASALPVSNRRNVVQHDGGTEGNEGGGDEGEDDEGGSKG